MRDAAPVFRRGDILLAGELLAGGDVPKTEFRLEPAVALARDAAGDEVIRVDLLPARKLRRDVDVVDVLDESGRIDRREETAAPQIIGDDAGDVGAGLAVCRCA